MFSPETMPHKRIGYPSEIGSTAETAYHHIRPFPRHLHLLLRLEADYGLMQGDMIQHTAQRVLATRHRRRQLHRLRNRSTQTTLMIGRLCQNSPPSLGRHTWRSHYLSTPYLHQRPAVGFLFITQLDHVHGQFQPEYIGRVCQGSTPLSGPGLGSNIRKSLLLAVIGLGQSRVELMRPYRADTLVLEIDMRRCIQGLLQTICPHQRRRPVETVLVPHCFGNLNPPVHRIQLLPGSFFRKYPAEVLQCKRLTGNGVQSGPGLLRHICHDVVPSARDIALFEDESFSGFHDSFDC